jgi:GNAT superfamily N-acetyltransferase
LAEAVLESPAEGIVEIGIVIDPHIRGIGVGTALVRELLSVAAHAGARKAVFRFNPCDPRIPSIVRSLGGRVSLRDEEGHVDATTFGRRSDAPIASAAAEGVPRTRDTRDMFR